MRWIEHRMWNYHLWAQIPVLSLPNCGTADKLLALLAPGTPPPAAGCEDSKMQWIQNQLHVKHRVSGCCEIVSIKRNYIAAIRTTKTETRRQQVSVRMWKNWNSCALLVGMWVGAATVENMAAVPQKIKHRITI